MAGLGDMLARAQAAQGMMRGGGEAPPEEMPLEEAAPEAAPVDLNGALDGVEAALEGMNPSDAEEARTHVNAIREIAARSEGAETAPEAPPMGEEELPTPADGDEMGPVSGM